jgi:hypothetical protein
VIDPSRGLAPRTGLGCRRWGALVALTLAIGVGAARASAQPADEALLPLDSYTTADARALASAHAGELRALQGALARCPAGAAIHRHGLAFRRPRGQTGALPYLSLWVWLEPADGADLAARAADAFRRHGPRLFRRLVGRSAVFADARVGGYGLVLSWIGPRRQEGREVAESLAVFANKLAAANFAHDTIGPATLLSRAEVRLFDGQTEVTGPRIPIEDSADTVPAPGC